MFEARLLFDRLKHGDTNALRDIYYKYKNDMLGLAVVLVKGTSLRTEIAEDVVHDVFVSFAERAGQIEKMTNIKGYLLAGVANRIRNLRKSKQSGCSSIEVESVDFEFERVDGDLMTAEQIERIDSAIGQLPYEQREVIILHLYSGLKFRTIAEAKGESINTIQSRYRYGLQKMQSVLKWQGLKNE